MTSRTAEKALPFFKNNRTPAFFWIVGLLYGDGCIPANSTVTQFAGQNETMEKVHAIIGGTLRQLATDFCEINIYSNELRSWWFENTELVGGKKSHTIRFPEKLLAGSADNTWHFLRGFFDADGFVSSFSKDRLSWKHKGLPELSTGITCASPDFIDQFTSFVKQETGVEIVAKSSTKEMNGKTYVCFSANTKGSDARIFLERLYQDKEQNFYSVKFNKFIDYLTYTADAKSEICHGCGLVEVWNYKTRQCSECFWESKEKNCICGQPHFAFGVCQAMYHRYRRLNLASILNDDTHALQPLIEAKKFSKIDAALHDKIYSFYSAKHEGFKSPVEHWNGKKIGNIRANIANIYNIPDVRVASWFKSSDAHRIVELLEERHGKLSKCLDPFAGWGARAAGVLAANAEYVGIDANPALWHELSSFYDLQSDAVFLNENSFEIDFKHPLIQGSDFVLTCPPYWKAEDYGYKIKEERKYSTFIRRIFEMMLKLASSPDMRVMAICLEDFTYKGKKYSFEDDFKFFLNKFKFSYEKIIYSAIPRNDHKDYLEKKVFIITWEREQLIESFDGMTFHIGKTCSVDDCEEQSSAKGKCNAHYLKDKWREDHGEPTRRSPVKKVSDICKWPECSRPVKARNFCQLHDRWTLDIAAGKVSQAALEEIARNNKRPGRPAAMKIPCSECGEPESANMKQTLCKKCYLRAYHAKKKENIKPQDE